VVKRETGWHERTVEIAATATGFGFAASRCRDFEVLLPPLGARRTGRCGVEWRPRRIHEDRNPHAQSVRRALIIDYGHIRSNAATPFRRIARPASPTP